MECSFVNFNREKLECACSKDFDDEILHKVEVAGGRALLLDGLVLGVRVEKDGENLPYVPKKVLVDAFIPDYVCFKLLKLKFLSVLVQDGF